MIYYVAFIVLTLLIVKYARQTYELESSRHYELLCKLTVPNPEVEYSMFPFSLEIFNAGNLVACNVKVTVDGQYLTTIDFIKPGSAELFPLGTMGCMLNGNRLEPGFLNVNTGDKINVTLLVNEREQQYVLNTDILFVTRPHENYNRDNEKHLERIASYLKSINDKGIKMKQ